MVSIFAAKFALKSILRKPRKQLGLILAVALGVTLLIGVQVGSNGIEHALANGWYGSIGQTDLAVYDPANPLLPGNVSDYLVNQAALHHLSLVSERLDLELTFYLHGVLQKNVIVQGLQPEHQTTKLLGSFYDLKGQKVDGRLLEANNTIFVNSILADKLGISIGDSILSSMFNGLNGSTPLKLQVVAIIDADVGRGVEGQGPGGVPIAYTNVQTLQAGLTPALQSYVSEISFQFSGVDHSIAALDIAGKTFPGRSIVERNLNATAAALEMLDHQYRVYSARLQIADSIKDNVAGIASVLTLFVFILNLVGLLLIINVQAMSLDDRRYQTAVLRAMGSNKSQIFMVFLIESAIVGVIGALVGAFFGIFYGRFVEQTIGRVFGLPPTSSINFDPTLLGTAMLFGVALAVITAAIPAWWAASRSITNELRGIESETISERRSRKPFVLGLTTLLAGLWSAQNIGKFWLDEAWTTFEDTTRILIALGFSIFGAGLLLSYIRTRFGYNIAALGFYGLAIWALFNRLDLVQEGDGNNWLLVVMLYLVIGVVMLVTVNFDVIMAALHRFLSLSPNMRAISQVSTKQMVARKGRLTMVFTVLTLVLVLNVFIAVSADSIAVSNVQSYQVRSDGIEIVINSDVPSAAIKQVVQDLPEVENVFAFRSFMSPVYRADPGAYNQEELTSFLRFRQVIEFNQSEVNPDGNWNGNSFLPYTFGVNDINVDGQQYKHEIGLSHDQNQALTKTMLKQFWSNPQVDYTAELKDANWNITGTEHRQGRMIIGDFSTDTYKDLYFRNANGSTINTYQVGAVFNMLGPFAMVSGALLVTPQFFAQLPGAATIKQPNVFLVRSIYGYNDVKQTQALSIKIEQLLNDLSNPQSLSSQQGILLGATTRIVEQEVSTLWAQEAAFWNFLNIFSALGLIIGAMGMIIIAIRSVQERTREIGMMRAIGFKRSTVVFTVALELVFVSVVGLVAGLINGALMTIAFLKTLLGVPPSYPYGLLSIYVLGVTSLAIIAGILPGIRASRIPASEALRYTG